MTAQPAHAIERSDDPNQTLNAMLDLAERSVRTALDAGGERARLALAERFGRMGLIEAPVATHDAEQRHQFDAIELANLLGILKACSRLVRGEAALNQLRWARTVITSELKRRQGGQHACTTGKLDDGTAGCDRPDARSGRGGGVDCTDHRGDQPVPPAAAQGVSEPTYGRTYGPSRMDGEGA